MTLSFLVGYTAKKTEAEENSINGRLHVPNVSSIKVNSANLFLSNARAVNVNEVISSFFLM